LLGSYYKGVMNVGRGLARGVGKLFGGGDGEGGALFGGGGKKQVEWLEKIYALLDERIKKPEVVRDGSWEQLMGRDKKEDEPEDADNDSMADAKKGLFAGGLGGLLGGLADKLNPFEGGVNVDLPGGGGRRPPPPPNPRGGRMSRLWQGTKNLGGKVVKAGKWALPALGALLPSAATLAGAASSAGAGLAAIGSVLASPVVLAGAAVAAVGIGGYMLYKNFANDPDGPLHSFRLMQYGIDPDAGDPVARISALEDKLEGEVQLGSGTASINQSVDAKELLEICGIADDDDEAKQAWAMWFQMRFKPVFLSHIAVLSSLASSVKLASVDGKIDDALKTTYLKRVHFKEGSDAPYRATQYVPFDDIES
jgi:hypothetical protein